MDRCGQIGQICPNELGQKAFPRASVRPSTPGSLEIRPMERSDYAKIYAPPRRPHLEQVEHRQYSWALSSVCALLSGCVLSGVIALDSRPGVSNAIAAFPVSFVEFPRGRSQGLPKHFQAVQSRYLN